MSIKIGNTSINKLYLGATEINKLYLGSTEIYSPGENVVITTTSNSSTWTPQEVLNSGGDITWGVNGSQVQVLSGNNVPTFNLSAVVSPTITAKSSTSFVGFTSLQLDQLDCESINIAPATDLVKIDAWQNPIDIIDLTKNINLVDIWLQDCSLDAFDLELNTLAKTIYLGFNNNLDSSTLDKIVVDLDNNGVINGVLEIADNAGNLTPAVQTEYNSLESKGWQIDVPAPGVPGDNNLRPVLSNFRIDAELDRVYFNSSEVITVGINGDVGFTITDKTISSVTINTGLLTNHYFTVSAAFTYYDNHLIRYDGTGDMVDSLSNGVYSFTLQQITNSIVRPSTTSEKYVTVNGSGSHDGSLGNEWTFAEACSNAIAGDHVNMAKGNYGSINFTVANSGTLANPIIFEGYNITPGDSPSLNRSIGMSFDSNVMPLLSGSSGYGINLDNRSFIILKNIQIENFSSGSFNVGHINNMIFDNIYMSGGFLGIDSWSRLNEKVRVLNSYCADVTGQAFTINNEQNYIDNCWAVSSQNVGMDYYIAIGGGPNGVNNSVRNCYVYRFPTDSHGGHGTILKADEHLQGYIVEHSLIEDCYVENLHQGFTFQHQETRFNVVRGCSAGVSGGSTASNLIQIRDDASYNIVENCYAEDVSQGIKFDMNANENAGIQAGGHHNKIINTVLKNVVRAIYINNGIDGTALESTFNEFINMTIYGSSTLAYNVSVPFGSSNEFINCIISDTTSKGNTTPSFSYSDFYNGFAAPSGTGNIDVKPEFTDVDNGGFRLSENTPVSVYEGGTDAGVYYDAKGMERKPPFSMGMDEWNAGNPFFTKQYSESIYAETILIPDYDSGNSAHKLISVDADWSDINSGTYKHFYVEPGLYASTSRVSISSSGTKSEPRTISLYNGNDIHPAKLNTSQLARIRFAINGESYWIIDRMAYWENDTSGDISNYIYPDSHNNIINRYYQKNVNAGCISIRTESNYNTIQNCRVERDDITQISDFIAFAMSNNGSNNQVSKGNKFIQNETYNCNDAIQLSAIPEAATGVSYEGTIIDCNHMYIDNVIYTDGSGNHDVNGAYAYAENAIDLKNGSLDADNPIIITNNYMAGFRESDQTNSTLSDWGVAITIHFGVPNVIIEDNLMVDSNRAVTMTSGSSGITIDNNIIKDIIEYTIVCLSSNDILFKDNLLKDVVTNGSVGKSWDFGSATNITMEGNLTLHDQGRNVAVSGDTPTLVDNGWFDAVHTALTDASDINYGTDPTVNYNDINFTTDNYTDSPKTITVQKVQK